MPGIKLAKADADQLGITVSSNQRAISARVFATDRRFLHRMWRIFRLKVGGNVADRK